MELSGLILAWAATGECKAEEEGGVQVRRIRPSDDSTVLSDGTIRPVSGSALEVRHRKDRHGIRVKVVSIDEPKRKSLHEVAAIGFVDERPTLWVVENVINRDLELPREVPRGRG